MSKNTYLILQNQIRRLQEQAEQIKAKERTPIIHSIVRHMIDYDISLEEIAETFENKDSLVLDKRIRLSITEKKVNKPASIRYYNPETGEKWSGRGKLPLWIAAIERNGGSRETYLISSDTEIN